MLQLIYLAELLALSVLAVLAFRRGNTSWWEVIGAISAIAAPISWTVVVTWHTIDAGKTLVVIGVLLLPLPALIIYGVSRRMPSRRWRQGGTALAACWVLGALGIVVASPLLAVLSSPAFLFLPFWAVKAATEMRREPPRPPAALVAQT